MLGALYKKLSFSESSTSVRTPFYTDRSSTDDHTSSQHLLDDSKDDAHSDFDHAQYDRRRQKSYFRAIIAHSLIFATYSLALFAASVWYSQRAGPDTLVYCKIQTFCNSSILSQELIL